MKTRKETRMKMKTRKEKNDEANENTKENGGSSWFWKLNSGESLSCQQRSLKGGSGGNDIDSGETELEVEEEGVPDGGRGFPLGGCEG